MPKIVKRTILSVIIMIALFVVAGVIYVFMTGKSGYKQPVTSANTTKPVQQLPKPRLPGANAQEGVAVQSLMSPVNVGTNTSITIATNATSSCTIDVSYKGVKSTDSGLLPKTADDYGSVTWTWTVDSLTPPGDWPIKITCTYHGKTGFVATSLKVVKP